MDATVKQAIKEEFDVIHDKLDAIMSGLLYQVDGSSLKVYKELNEKRNEIAWEAEEMIER